MDCTGTCHEAPARGHGWPDEGLRAPLDAWPVQQISDRQAAVTYLEAARLTPDAAIRERLRRRGVELLLRRPGVPRVSELGGGERSGGRHS